MSGQWLYIIKGLHWDLKILNFKANSCNLSVVYTKTNNLINKGSELLTIISADNPDIICIAETLPKHTHLPINDRKLQVHDYYCFSNITESNCHGGVIFYVKKCLNATSFRINQNRLKECSCCKIVLKGNTILYIISKIPSYILSPNSATGNNYLLNQTIENVSKLKGGLLL